MGVLGSTRKNKERALEKKGRRHGEEEEEKEEAGCSGSQNRLSNIIWDCSMCIYNFFFLHFFKYSIIFLRTPWTTSSAGSSYFCKKKNLQGM